VADGCAGWARRPSSPTPRGIETARQAPELRYVATAEQAVDSADLVLLLTEWPELVVHTEPVDVIATYTSTRPR